MKINELKELLLKDNIKLTFVQNIDDNHQYHYWYGNNVAEIEIEGITISIGAWGDVEGTYYEEDLSTELEEFKDRTNRGGFSYSLSYYLKSDFEVTEAINKDRLVFENNNWWEISILKDGEWIFPDYVLDSSYITDAIAEVVENINWIKSEYEYL